MINDVTLNVGPSPVNRGEAREVEPGIWVCACQSWAIFPTVFKQQVRDFLAVARKILPAVQVFCDSHAGGRYDMGYLHDINGKPIPGMSEAVAQRITEAWGEHLLATTKITVTFVNEAVEEPPKL